MFKVFGYIVRDIRGWLKGLSRGEQIAFVVIWVLMILRASFPILHVPNGYVLYLYPWQDWKLCELQICDLDRSRTFAASATLGLTALGVGALLRSKRNSKES